MRTRSDVNSGKVPQAATIGSPNPTRRTMYDAEGGFCYIFSGSVKHSYK